MADIVTGALNGPRTSVATRGVASQHVTLSARHLVLLGARRPQRQICMCVYIYIYIYIYIHMLSIHIYIYIYIHIYVHICETYVYIYIYIYREREREGYNTCVQAPRVTSCLQHDLEARTSRHLSAPFGSASGARGKPWQRFVQTFPKPSQPAASHSQPDRPRTPLA